VLAQPECARGGGTNAESDGSGSGNDLALMDHPNIARVLDAGATDSGRPYFVMELVRGNHTLQACKQFCRWAVNDRRVLENPPASCLALSGGPKGTLVDSDGLPSEARLQCVGKEKTAVSAGFPTPGSVCTFGDGPGLQNQRGV
jgi:hypothetical protein